MTEPDHDDPRSRWRRMAVGSRRVGIAALVIVVVITLLLFGSCYLESWDFSQ